MLYKIGSIARKILSIRNCVIYLITIALGNIALSAYTPSIGGHYGVVINTTPREFVEVDKNHPYTVVSSCTIVVQFTDRYGTELKSIIDQGCVYKPGDKIERYLKARSALHSTLYVVITAFVLVVILALLIPKHPSIRPCETISNEKH